MPYSYFKNVKNSWFLRVKSANKGLHSKDFIGL